MSGERMKRLRPVCDEAVVYHDDALRRWAQVTHSLHTHAGEQTSALQALQQRVEEESTNKEESFQKRFDVLQEQLSSFFVKHTREKETISQKKEDGS